MVTEATYVRSEECLHCLCYISRIGARVGTRFKQVASNDVDQAE